MNLNLIIDIGNTRTKIGYFKSNKLSKKLIWEKWDLKKLKTLFDKNNFEAVAMSYTGKIPSGVDRFLGKQKNYIKLSAQTSLPIKNLYKTPKTLGRDRIAAVVAANELFPKNNVLVIDAGTCITYDLIDKKANYHGGNISPGIEMRLKAMNHFTAALPVVQRRKLKSPMGNTTDTSMRTGAQYGATMEIEGFIKTYRNTFGSLNVILTGGDAKYFANQLKTKIFVNQNLVLLGLNKILNYNVQLPE